MSLNRDFTSPISDRFSLEDVINGLARDLESLRAGAISPHDALARAAIAKQIMSGARLVVQAQRFLDQRAKDVSALAAPDIEP